MRVRPRRPRVRPVLLHGAPLAPALVHDIIVHPPMERTHVHLVLGVNRVQRERLPHGGAIPLVHARARQVALARGWGAQR